MQVRYQTAPRSELSDLNHGDGADGENGAGADYSGSPLAAQQLEYFLELQP